MVLPHHFSSTFPALVAKYDTNVFLALILFASIAVTALGRILMKKLVLVVLLLSVNFTMVEQITVH